jgi:hypothetical protein
MSTQKRQYALALMLLTASVLAIYPGMTLEKPQGLGTISISASGQAYPRGTAKCTGSGLEANLILMGSVRTEGNGEVKLSALSGTLQAGTETYVIADGAGEINKKGKMQINAKTSDSDHRLELVLHGSVQGDTAVFSCPESKLSSLYCLALSGTASMTSDTTSATTSSIAPETVTVTVTQENTVTMTEDSNQTLTETVTATITDIVTETVTQSGTNSTVTVTETVTTTIANSTVTVTTSLGNTTLTAPQT